MMTEEELRWWKDWCIKKGIPEDMAGGYRDMYYDVDRQILDDLNRHLLENPDCGTNYNEITNTYLDMERKRKASNAL